MQLYDYRALGKIFVIMNKYMRIEVYLWAGMDVAMAKQVFVKSRQQLVEVTGRISLSLAIT